MEWSPDFLEVPGRVLVPVLTELPVTRSHRSVQVCSTRDCSGTIRTQARERAFHSGRSAPDKLDSQVPLAVLQPTLRDGLDTAFWYLLL